MDPVSVNGETAPVRRSARKARRERRKQQRRRLYRKLLLGTVTTGFVLSGLSVLAGIATPWGNHLRMVLAETIITTRHYYLARYITTGKEYSELWAQLHAPVVGTGVSKTVSVSPPPVHVVPKPPVVIQDVSGPGYKGYVMLVHDPKLVRLVAANVHNGMGEYITTMASRVGALAGTNASGFEDPKGEGWGGIPVGLEFIGGQVISQSRSDSSWATVGFTNDGVMVMGNYTPAQLTHMGVRDAMQFHPELVVNGKPTITVGDGGWGYGPRTAIGQARDGTVIFVVINGRFNDSGMGASQKQVMDIMLQYGAVNACAMDGGSSSVLVHAGKIVNSPSTIDPNHQRHLPDAWLVFATEAQAQSYHP